MTDGEWRLTCEQLAGIHFCMRVLHDDIETLDDLLLDSIFGSPVSSLSQTLIDHERKLNAPPKERDDYLSQFELYWLRKIDNIKKENLKDFSPQELLKQFKESA